MALRIRYNSVSPFSKQHGHLILITGSSGSPSKLEFIPLLVKYISVLSSRAKRFKRIVSPNTTNIKSNTETISKYPK